MTTAGRTLWPAPFLDQRGNRRAGLAITVYVKGRGPAPAGDGSLTKANLFTDDALTIPGPNPVTTDADGNETAIKAAPGTYDAVVAGETIPFAVVDPLGGGGGGAVASVDGQTGVVDLSDTYGQKAVVDDLVVQVDALEAGGADPNAITVLEFTGGESCHINLGPFWPLDVDLGHFHYDAWIAALAEGYLVSDGAGGGHGLLWGFLGTTLLKITGNIWPGTTPLTTFGSDDGVEPGEWALHSVARDATHIYVYLEGILTGITPYSDVRRAGYGQLFVMGSDHQNAAGRLHTLRGFEDGFPLGSYPLIGFVPQKYLSGYAADGSRAALLLDCTKPGAIIPDISDGYDGAVHPGTLHASAFIGGRGDFDSGAPNGEPVGPGRAKWVVDPTAPFDVDGEIVPAGYIPASPAMPVGAKVWDTFDRAKQTWLTRAQRRITLLSLTANVATVTTATPHGYVAGDKVRVQSHNGDFNGDFTISVVPTATSFSYALTHANVAPVAGTGMTSSFRSLGLTEAGSLGPLRWQYSTNVFGSMAWGILNGRAVHLFGYGQSRATAWVDTDSADMGVIVSRRVNAEYGTHLTGLSLRQDDTDHHFSLETTGTLLDTDINLVRNLGGTLAYPATFAAPATAWEKLMGVFSGTTLTVFVDDLAGGWTEIGAQTGLTDMAGAVGAGLSNSFAGDITQAHRYDNFTVVAA